MKVTDVKVRKIFEEGPMKAVVSVTLDDCAVIHDIKVVEAAEKKFVVMPSNKLPDGSYRDIVHPTNSNFRTELTARVLEAYEVQKAITNTEQ